ncbi:MAG: hypothetical protein ACRDHW_12605, partial [Ktedonobacteraceae bacterium]
MYKSAFSRIDSGRRHICELKLVQEINRSVELEPILDALLQRAAEHVFAESGSILLADEKNEVLA